MDKTIHNYEVSQGNFNSIVIMNSYKLPVFALFMSPSIGACITLENNMANLAEEFAGQFILARVDVDMEPDLREEYQIQNVPTLKIFKDGQMVHQEVGLLNEQELADLMKAQGFYRQSDEMREQARQKHISGDTSAAIQLLTEAIQQDPSNTRVAMDMIQILLDINIVDQAKTLFNRLPNKDKESVIGKSLIGQITFKDLAANTPGLVALVNQVQSEPGNFDARFDLALCYVAEHGYEEAMNQIFEILDKEPGYKQGAAQELAVTIINMLEPNNPQLAQDSRRILSNMLAQ
ncbi:thioredoxin [Thiomicrorhabdus immobilis]|uniref:Thioredoxin n=1 Tax=Thiomicrorhabdus immobilis TaxID=2791037 RepID=A0ABN6CX91_9GAMM|nr:tetratricopeptide repeat protein [Thiomicrorhabdus immobilis]BCN92507.1 thioredoxin [Thiomicrorhabdus immobilis]